MRRVLVIALLAASALLISLAGHVTFAATLPVNHDQFVQRVIDLVNVERQNAGLAPLTSNAALTRAAQDYSVVLADGSCFAHDCGSTVSQRLDQVGYTSRQAWGENIAWGQATPEAVMAAWMNSSGHRANILNPDYRDIGVGLAAKSSGGLVWVQDFGKSRTVSGTPPTPTPVPPTPTPAPPIECSPRPAFNVLASPSAPGVLQVTVTVGTSGGAANNTLQTIRIGSVVNGALDVSGRGRVASGTTITLASGTQQATLSVHRVASGAATTVPLVLTDACGEWPTLVGGGPSAF
jgi:cysteine-rich secretory family protein